MISCLGPGSVLVGQRVQGDIEWMQLEAGKHFDNFIDISDSFKTFNSRFGNYNYYSLAQEAYALLNINLHGSNAHSPVTDCQIQLKLYENYCMDPSKLLFAKSKLRELSMSRGFPDSTKSNLRPVIDGVCHFKFSPEKCFCGQPTSRD